MGTQRLGQRQIGRIRGPTGKGRGCTSGSDFYRLDQNAVGAIKILAGRMRSGI